MLLMLKFANSTCDSACEISFILYLISPRQLVIQTHLWRNSRNKFAEFFFIKSLIGMLLALFLLVI